MLNLRDAQLRKIADVTKFNKFKALQGIPGIFSKYGFTTSPKKTAINFLILLAVINPLFPNVHSKFQTILHQNAAECWKKIWTLIETLKRDNYCLQYDISFLKEWLELFSMNRNLTTFSYCCWCLKDLIVQIMLIVLNVLCTLLSYIFISEFFVIPYMLQDLSFFVCKHSFLLGSNGPTTCLWHFGKTNFIFYTPHDHFITFLLPKKKLFFRKIHVNLK